MFIAIAAAALVAAQSAAPASKRAVFDVRHELAFDLPEGAKELRVWAALPQKDRDQEVESLRIEAPLTHRVMRDARGNEVLYLEGRAPELPRKFSVVTTFKLRRREVVTPIAAAHESAVESPPAAELARELEPNEHVVIDDEVKKLAAEIVGGEKDPVKASRKIYDWVLANVEYWVKTPATAKASPVGSSAYCLKSRTGNCTDFHSLYAALSRAAGIPTRMVYGSFLKKELDRQDVDQSYHCWIEFWTDRTGWVPIDVAVADIYVGEYTLDEQNSTLVRRTTADGYTGPDPARVDYYFGNLDERRVTWSIGRDLVLDPPPAAGKVNMLAKAHVELDGKPLAEKSGWTRKLTYAQVE